MHNRRDIYLDITNRILGLLEQGTIPWRQPWDATPMNYVSKKPYRGINVWLLLSGGYALPYFLTYLQAKNLRGYVRKGEKGTQVVFWKWIEKEVVDPDTEEEEVCRIPILRYYTVFNLAQCCGIAVPTRPVEAIASAEEVIANYQDPPTLRIGGNVAAYSPTNDTVYLPARQTFDSSSEYHSTQYHEYIHSTGHKSRLDREGLKEVRYASETYSQEELVAEMGAAYLCAISGTELMAKTLDNSAAYLQYWLSKLREDKRLIVHASSQAQRAVDWILGKRAANDEEK